MIKRQIQRRNAHSSNGSAQSPGVPATPGGNQDSWTQTLGSSFTTATAIITFGISTGVFIGILRLVGELYASAYLAVLRIHPFQLTFSEWDYGSRGVVPAWMGLLFGVIIIGIGSLYYAFLKWVFEQVVSLRFWHRLFIAAVPLVIYVGLASFNGSIQQGSGSVYAWISIGVLCVAIVAAPLVQSWIKSIGAGLRRAALVLAPVALALAGVPAIVFGLGPIAESFGTSQAHHFLTRQNMQVRLIANEDLVIDAPHVTPVVSNGETLYMYDGLYVLTINEGRYFLFKTLDANCHPEQVYIVQEEQLRSVQYHTAPTPSCVQPPVVP